MRNTSTPTVRPHSVQAHQARFAWWLAVAVLLHALLLLIPARQYQLPEPALRTLTVALSRTLRAPPPANPAESSRRDAAPVERRLAPPGTPNADLPPAAAPRAAPPLPALDIGVQPDTTHPPITTARLLEFAHRRKWNLREPSVAPGPGVFRPQPPPPNWRSGTPAESTALPAEAGIVDQWLAADGSSNRMIRLPNGELLCGRAEAWNPMSPLVEPVMMYRACGNGRRTFEMPERVLLR
jgi:hypothetical protein